MSIFWLMKVFKEITSYIYIESQKRDERIRFCIVHLRSEIIQWAPIIAGARLSEVVPSENTKRLIEIINSYCPVP